MHKQLNYEHVERANSLATLSKQLGGWFTKANKYEINCQSYADFYMGRLNYLATNIKPEDYLVNPRGEPISASSAPNIRTPSKLMPPNAKLRASMLRKQPSLKAPDSPTGSPRRSFL